LVVDVWWDPPSFDPQRGEEPGEDLRRGERPSVLTPEVYVKLGIGKAFGQEMRYMSGERGLAYAWLSRNVGDDQRMYVPGSGGPQQSLKACGLLHAPGEVRYVREKLAAGGGRRRDLEKGLGHLGAIPDYGAQASFHAG
jgi:hypothetical protein